MNASNPNYLRVSKPAPATLRPTTRHHLGVLTWPLTPAFLNRWWRQARPWAVTTPLPWDDATEQALTADDQVCYWSGYEPASEGADPLLGPSGQATPTDGFLSFGLSRVEQEPTLRHGQAEGPRLSWEAHVYGRRSYDEVDRGEDGYGQPS